MSMWHYMVATYRLEVPSVTPITYMIWLPHLHTGSAITAPSLTVFWFLVGGWDEVDETVHDSVSLEEWSAFFAKLKEDKGEGLHRKVGGRSCHSS